MIIATNNKGKLEEIKKNIKGISTIFIKREKYSDRC